MLQKNCLQQMQIVVDITIKRHTALAPALHCYTTGRQRTILVTALILPSPRRRFTGFMRYLLFHETPPRYPEDVMGDPGGIRWRGAARGIGSALAWAKEHKGRCKDGALCWTKNHINMKTRSTGVAKCHRTLPMTRCYETPRPIPTTSTP